MDFRVELRELREKVEAAEAAQVAANTKAVHLHRTCQGLATRVRRLELTLPGIARWAQTSQLIIPVRPKNLDYLLMES